MPTSHRVDGDHADIADLTRAVVLEYAVRYDAPDEVVEIGHIYNSVFRTRLKQQADAIWFVPQVTPMRTA